MDYGREAKSKKEEGVEFSRLLCVWGGENFEDVCPKVTCKQAATLRFAQEIFGANLFEGRGGRKGKLFFSLSQRIWFFGFLKNKVVVVVSPLLLKDDST